jgi:hypothetical protein
MEHGIGARDEIHAGVPGAPYLVVYAGLEVDGRKIVIIAKDDPG